MKGSAAGRQSLRRIIIFLFTAVLLLSSCGSEKTLVIEKFDETEVRVSITAQPEEAAGMISVYVCGAVVSPGVYELEEGSRIRDAVDAAGGFAGDVDERYINLASLLKDGQQITVYTKDELQSSSEAVYIIDNNSSDDGKININTAGKEQLMTLPGIGEARAEAIINYREEYGGFSEKEDIKNISGIGDKMYEKLAGLIEV